MKKIYVFLLTLVILGSSGLRADDETFKVGLKLGFGMAFKGGEFKPPKTTPLYGPMGGVFFEVHFNDYIAIRPEINFASQGQRSVVTAGDNKWITTFGLGYLQFPLLAKGTYGNDKIAGFVNFGPQFGAGLFAAGRIKTKIDGERDREKIETSFDDLNLRRFDAGLAVGVGLQCQQTGFQFETRYYQGLADIQDWGDMGRPDGFKKTTNSAFQISLGYTF